jgi:glycosyltransferase involved in cell wall biosynthesis
VFEESFSEESRHEEKVKIRADLGLKDGIQISAFGRILRHKRIDVLLKAFSMLLNRGLKDAHLVLVGELFSDVQEQILKQISDLHLTEAVTITGYVSSQDFIKYMNATDICVNLRYPSAGETSATLIKALSMGLPVITTNYAQYKEYPDACCWKVDLGGQEVELLAEFLFVLATNEDVRKQMSINAIKYSSENNNIERTVGQYLEAIRYGIKRKKLAAT